MFLEILQYSQENTRVFNKVAGLQASERLCRLLLESIISLEWTIHANNALKNQVSHEGFSQ